MEWARLEPLLLDFDPDKYIYLVDSTPRDVFLKYVKIFQDLYAKYNPLAMKFREQLASMKIGKPDGTRQ
jgi:hypothetical protein